MVPFFHKVSELSSPEIAQTVFPMFPYASIFDAFQFLQFASR